MMIIIVTLKNKCGNDWYYPVNEIGQKLIKLMKGERKGFSKDELKAIKEIGFQIELQQQELDI